MTLNIGIAAFDAEQPRDQESWSRHPRDAQPYDPYQERDAYLTTSRAGLAVAIYRALQQEIHYRRHLVYASLDGARFHQASMESSATQAFAERLVLVRVMGAEPMLADPLRITDSISQAAAMCSVSKDCVYTALLNDRLEGWAEEALRIARTLLDLDDNGLPLPPAPEGPTCAFCGAAVVKGTCTASVDALCAPGVPEGEDDPNPSTEPELHVLEHDPADDPIERIPGFDEFSAHQAALRAEQDAGPLGFGYGPGQRVPRYTTEPTPGDPYNPMPEGDEHEHAN